MRKIWSNKIISYEQWPKPKSSPVTEKYTKLNVLKPSDIYTLEMAKFMHRLMYRVRRSIVACHTALVITVAILSRSIDVDVGFAFVQAHHYFFVFVFQRHRCKHLHWFSETLGSNFERKPSSSSLLADLCSTRSFAFLCCSVILNIRRCCTWSNIDNRLINLNTSQLTLRKEKSYWNENADFFPLVDHIRLEEAKLLKCHIV